MTLDKYNIYHISGEYQMFGRLYKLAQYNPLLFEFTPFHFPPRGKGWQTPSPLGEGWEGGYSFYGKNGIIVETVALTL